MSGLGRRLLALCLLFAATAGAAQPARQDQVRVLIDVSGSMKQNDPQNLRAPALRLLVNLLPPDARAGAWSFAQYVNALVPFGAATPPWREEALRASAAIHSRGLFTDIGAALDAATRDWQEPDPSSRRSLILLTDGMVDVSKDPAANVQARQRVLQDLLPRLRDAGIQVHTIALSANADAELLRALSTATDGAYEQTDSAEALQRVFLRMFERAVSRDSLPLEDNRFQVDPAIQEVTLLVFHGPDDAPTRVQPPGGAPFAAAAAPGNVRWHGERGYDLITIDKPAPGEWRLLAATDPDNRALIVTDLKLALSELPNNLLQGEQIPLQVSLREGEQTITRADFLQLVDVRLVQQSAGAAPREWVLADNGLSDDAAAGDGIFTIQLGPTLTGGSHELLVAVRSATFVRERRLSVQVAASPLSVNVHPPLSEPGPARKLRLAPALDWIDSGSLRVGARSMRPDGTSEPLELTRLPGGGWEADLTGRGGRMPYEVAIEVAGKTTTDRDFKLELPMLKLPAEQPIEAAAPGEPSPPAAQPAPEPEAEPEVNWLLVSTVLVTANLAVFGLIALGVYLWRSRRRPTPTVGAAEAAVAAVAAEAAPGTAVDIASPAEGTS